MVTRDEAVAAAERYLRTKSYPERVDSVVVLPDTAIKFPYGWTVRFDFREHLNAGDPTLAPFSSVVVVPHDGTEPHFPPTALPVHQYLALRADGAWPGSWRVWQDAGWGVDPERQAAGRLRAMYGGVVELADRSPVHESATAWLMAAGRSPSPAFPAPHAGGLGCRPQGPLADLDPVAPAEAAHRVQGQPRRLNARLRGRRALRSRRHPVRRPALAAVPRGARLVGPARPPLLPRVPAGAGERLGRRDQSGRGTGP